MLPKFIYTLITNYKLILYLGNKMYLEKIETYNFRLYEDVEFTFHKESTRIVMKNNINIRGEQCSFQI